MKLKQVYKYFIMRTALLITLIFSNPAWSWCALTPAPDAPYYRIITSILQGIQQTVGDITLVSVEQQLPEKCLKNNKGFVLLGPDPYKHFSSVLSEATINIAVAVEVEKNPLISHWFKYIPSPASMTKELLKLEPQLKKIHILTNKEADMNLLQTSKEDMMALGVELINHEVPIPKQASKLFEKIIDTLDPQTEALWISPHQGQYGLQALLPSIIKQSLYSQKMSIGNNLHWIDKGIYIGVYPENNGFGQQIGHVMQNSTNLAEAKKKPQVYYIESVFLASNRKTHRFLDKKHTEEQLKNVKLWLPKN